MIFFFGTEQVRYLGKNGIMDPLRKVPKGRGIQARSRPLLHKSASSRYPVCFPFTHQDGHTCAIRLPPETLLWSDKQKAANLYWWKIGSRLVAPSPSGVERGDFYHAVWFRDSAVSFQRDILEPVNGTKRVAASVSGSTRNVMSRSVRLQWVSCPGGEPLELCKLVSKERFPWNLNADPIYPRV